MYHDDYERSIIILQEEWISDLQKASELNREEAIEILQLFEEAREENRILGGVRGRMNIGKKIYRNKDFYVNIDYALRLVSYGELVNMIAQEKWPQLCHIFSSRDGQEVLLWVTS